uniref:5-hydroxytryptamine receptor 3E n=1 Tax=Cercocebus atys TaxID=9531 RepID=A0A2K5P282_CERAT
MLALILSQATPGPALGPLSYRAHRVALLHLTHSMSTTGRGVTFTIKCSGFGQHGADPTALNSVFNRKAFRPVTISVPTRVNISFTTSAIPDVVSWDNIYPDWNPEEYEGITKKYGPRPWLPDILSIIELYPKKGLTALSIRYKKPMQDQNATPTLRLNSSMTETETVTAIPGSEGFSDPITTYRPLLPHQVAIRCRPSLYVINLLMPSGFLAAIDALMKSGKRVPFKIMLLPGYNIFLGTPLIGMDRRVGTNSGREVVPLALTRPPFPPGVYFALCLSLIVGSLLETIFITHLLHVATTHPPPLPRWHHSLLLHCTSPGRCCPTAPQKGNKGLGLTPTHLLCLSVSVKEAQWEHEAQKQHSVELWVQFSHVMDALLFRLYLPFMASSILAVTCLWNT